jgi:hypothetical protein
MKKGRSVTGIGRPSFVDATDDPLHGNQEDRFFSWLLQSVLFLPRYIFYGEHLSLPLTFSWQ